MAQYEKTFSDFHFHADYEVHYVKSGSFLFSVNGDEYLLNENSLLIIPPGASHSIRTLGPGTKICFQCQCANKGPNIYMLRNKIESISYSMYEADTFIRILSDFNSNRSDSNFQKLKSIITILILNINDALAPQDAAKTTDVIVKSSVIDKVTDFIAKNYFRHVTLDEIAESAFFSKRQLSRIIKSETGDTFSGILTKFRITVAKKLMLESERPLEEISYAVGFSTYCGFWKAFCNSEQATPSEYKKNLVKNRAMKDNS